MLLFQGPASESLKWDGKFEHPASFRAAGVGRVGEHDERHLQTGPGGPVRVDRLRLLGGRRGLGSPAVHHVGSQEQRGSGG